MTPKGTGAKRSAPGDPDSDFGGFGAIDREGLSTGLDASTQTTGTTAPAAPVLRLPGKPVNAKSPALVADIAARLDETAPHQLLLYASVHAEVFDHRRLTPEELADAGVLDPSDLYESLANSGHMETLALLTALSHLAIDEDSRDLARWLVDETGRADTVAEWVHNLGESTLTGAIEVAAPDDDDDPHVDILLGIQTPGGHDLVMGLMIDDRRGALVDSMMGPATLAQIDPRNQAATGGPEVDPTLTFTDLSVTAAVTKLRDAIDTGAQTTPLPVSDTWPMQRPLLEWALRLPQIQDL